MDQQSRDRMFLLALVIVSLVVIVVSYGLFTKGFGTGGYEEDPRVEVTALLDR